MIKIIRYSLLILICFNFNIAYSQTVHKNSILFSDTTYECTIVTSQKKVYEDVKMFALSDSTLKIVKGDVVRILTIEEISSVKFNARGFGKGALIGGAIGAVLGAIVGGQGLGYNSDFNAGQAFAGAFIVGVPFLLIGGGLGALFASDQYFDLNNMNFVNKRTKIIILMKEFS